MIWSVNIPNTTNAQPGSIILPELVTPPAIKKQASPAQGIAAAQSIAPKTHLIDVVNNFFWTYSKPQSREELPVIYLKEKKLRVNALISQLKYAAGISGGALAGATAQTASFAQSNLNNIQSSIPEGVYKALQGLISGVQGVGNFAAGAVQTVNSAVEKYAASNGLNLLDNNNATLQSSYALSPYLNLYLTDPTGWEFLFPYFEDGYEAHANQFSSEGTVGGAFGELLAAGVGTAYAFDEFVGSIAHPTNITYAERAKFYNFPTDGDAITFSFPLINTGSVDYSDVVNNWQLLFMLLYNNKPARISPTSVEQPVIYELEIPGTRFYPFCYISNIDIKFQGSRRELQMNIPITANGQTGFKLINTIVPEAYYVTITLKSMLGDTRNFMYHLIDRGDKTVASSTATAT